MRKIINQPDAFVDEIMQGIYLAHPDQVRSANADGRALVRTDAGTNGRVGIVTGGGSGHLPLFLGYVGRGLASGCAVGNVFSSPSPEQIFEATMASDDGAGVLYLYGNYGGDVFNFDIAADLAAAEGVRTTTVLGRDDILSAPTDKADTRRGVAGIFFGYKCAGAAAERGYDLDRVTEIAQRACDRTRTMGVGLSPTILPAAGEPTFTLDEGEMEIGIGIHGEPGQFRGPLETADQITDRFLAELGKEIDFSAGKRIAVLVNGLGSTPLEELYLIYRHVHQTLTEKGVEIADVFIGEYATSLEMAGASLSICELDDELEELLKDPALSPFYQRGSVELTAGTRKTSEHKVAAAAAAGETAIATVDAPTQLRAIMLDVTEALPKHSDELRELDAALGDGDLGITIGSGAKAINEAISQLPDNAAPSELFKAAGKAFASANPSTYAALLGGALIGAAGDFADGTVNQQSLAKSAHTMVEKIMTKGGAKVGDKTVIDVIDAIANYLDSASGSAQEIIAGAVQAAQDVVAKQTEQVSQRGRAAWVGERSAGHKDPGSVAFLRVVEEIQRAL